MFPKGGMAGKWMDWLKRHWREAIDLAALAFSLALVALFITQVPLYGAVTALVVSVLIPSKPLGGRASPWRECRAALPHQVASVAASAVLVHYLLGRPLDFLWFGALWPAMAWGMRLDHRKVVAWVLRQDWILIPLKLEVVRIAFLAVSALWLMRGIERSTLHGGADALWYAMNLADAVTQVRSGIFPLFVGQSVYQFNGALCPIRIAPAFHHIGVALDFLTFRSLGTFSLQNLLLTLLGVAAIFSAYLGLKALMPERRWLAAGLAALFLACPGVLGIAYNTDLYMTWTTLPAIPIIWFATVRSFSDRGSVGTLALLGASLGYCWWGHSPIALWSTFFAAATQVVRILTDWRSILNWKALAAGAALFGTIAAYPMGSVLFFPPEPVTHVNLFQHATAGMVVYFNDQVMPDAVLPLSPMGRALSDFQLGYALWAGLLFLLWMQRRSLTAVTAALAASALFLALLLLPIPGLNLVLWSLVPGFVRDVTGNWDMSRLYLLLAAATVFGVASCVVAGQVEAPRRRRLLSVCVLVGCLWSFSEAAKFANGSKILSQTSNSAVDLLRPENIQITRYSYSLVPNFPSTFTHGVTDPNLENHLWSEDMTRELSTNLDAAATSGRVEATGTFVWGANGRADHATDSPAITIEPGKSYLLSFNFADPATVSGTLQIKGKHLFREYSIPEYGGTRSFGAGGMHPNSLPLWTTSGEEELELNFYPSNPAKDRVGPPVATVSLISYDPAVLPVRVDSWIPYRAKVTAPEAAWLETPRVYQTSYRATVNGMPALVRKSPDSLTAVEVPAGESTVELVYVAPFGLKCLFWLSFSSLLGAGLFGLGRSMFHRLPAASGSRAPATTAVT